MSLDAIKQKMVETCSSVNIHSENIDKLIEAWQKNKGPIMETVGLNEENDYRLRVTANMELEERKDIHNFLKAIACRSKYDINDFATMLQGKNVIKLGKILPKVAERIVYSGSFGQILHSMGMSPFQNQLIHAMESDKDTAEKIIHMFLVNYGDYVKNGRGLVISANPFDMLTASHNSTYKSCMRLGGEYFNGVLSHIVSPDILIAFLHENKNVEKKVGRQWVYANNSMYWGGRFYGAFYDTDADMVRNKILSAPAFEGNWKKSNMGLDAAHTDRKANWIYLDYNYNKVFKNENVTLKRFSIMVAPCLSCGKPIDHAKEGNCLACLAKHQRKCVACGDRINASQEMRTWGNRLGNEFLFHKACLEKSLMRCDKCGTMTPTWYMRRNLYTLKAKKQVTTHVCKDCEPIMEECYNCGAYWVQANRFPYVGADGYTGTICEQCKDSGHFIQCPECGVVHHKSSNCPCQIKEKVAV